MCFPQTLQEQTSQACIRQSSGVAKKRGCDLGEAAVLWKGEKTKQREAGPSWANERASVRACQFDW